MNNTSYDHADCGLSVINTPLDLPAKGKQGQKLLKFDRPDLVTSWAADIAAITKKSQSQVLEEVILQQFVPRSRMGQIIVDKLYSDKPVPESVLEALLSIFELALNRGDNEALDFKPVVRFFVDHLNGLNFQYGKKEDLYHFDYIPLCIHYFESCSALVARSAGSSKAKIEISRILSLYEKDSRNICLFPVTSLISPLLHHWDGCLDRSPDTYYLLFWIASYIRDLDKDLFDVRDRIELLGFINRLDSSLNLSY